VSVAETEEDALELLSNKPLGWRIVLSMDGDKSLDEMNNSGFVSASLIAHVQAAKGFQLQPGKSIHRTAPGGAASFLTQLHWTIRQIRSLVLAHTEIDRRSPRYVGWSWLKYDGQAAFRTARAEFEIIFAHDDPANYDPSDPVVLPSAFRIVAAAAEFYSIALSGTAHGRVPRFEAGAFDPTGTATGYAVTSAAAEFYTVAFDGIPHGRIPRFEA